MFESAEIIEEGKLYLRVELSGNYYPNETSARFELRTGLVPAPDRTFLR